MREQELELDALREVVNVGVGRAAATLSDMVETRVELHAPRVIVVQGEGHAELGNIAAEDRLAAVQQDFGGSIQGAAMILFPTASANRLVSLLLGEEIDEDELDCERSATLTEVGNIMINSVMGSIGNMTEVDFSFNLPSFRDTSLREIEETCLSDDSHLILIDVEFNIDKGHVVGNLMLVFKSPAARELFATLGRLVSAVP